MIGPKNLGFGAGSVAPWSPIPTFYDRRTTELQLVFINLAKDLESSVPNERCKYEY